MARQNEGTINLQSRCESSYNEKECKYWLDRANFGVAEAFSYTMTGKDKREVKRIIFEYFADQRTKANFELSPSGYGIHWPELDEDLSIDGMIKAAKVRKTG